MGHLLFIAISIALLTGECHSSMISTEALLEALGHESNEESEPQERLCRVPPTKLTLSDWAPGGVTFTYEHILDGECGGITYIQVQLFKGAELVSKSASHTYYVRGEVYRNLQPNVTYTLKARTYYHGSFSKAATLTFRHPMSQNHYDDNYNALERCRGQLTPPTNGNASQISSNSATVQYSWSPKSGCESDYLGSRLFRLSNNGNRQVSWYVSSLNHVRGQVYKNLRRGFNYRTDTYSARAEDHTSDLLTTSFQTKD